MRETLKYFKLIVICLFVIGISESCVKENENFRSNETAEISLQIPVLETSTRADEVDGTDDENTIHTLRIIILSQGSTSINELFSKDKIVNNTVTIKNVPVGPVQMYVIANEAALGRDYSDLATLWGELVDVPGHGHRKVLVKDEFRQWFPLRAVEPGYSDNPEEQPLKQRGLPMSWMDQELTVYPPSETPQNIVVNLQRDVAKLNIVMNNTLTEPIHIDKMTLGQFFGDRLYLFHEGALDVPDNAVYVKKIYGGESEIMDIEIPNGGSKSLVLYIYPSFAWRGEVSPYTIGFHTKAGKEYRETSFVNGSSALNSIARNTQVNINATLSKFANVHIAFSVEPWGMPEVEVPPFN